HPRRQPEDLALERLQARDLLCIEGLVGSGVDRLQRGGSGGGHDGSFGGDPTKENIVRNGPPCVANCCSKELACATFRRLSPHGSQIVPPTPLDAIDRKILRVLQENARIPNVELAQAVGLSPSTCLLRVRVLDERG